MTKFSTKDEKDLCVVIEDADGFQEVQQVEHFKANGEVDVDMIVDDYNDCRDIADFAKRVKVYHLAKEYSVEYHGRYTIKEI